MPAVTRLRCGSREVIAEDQGSTLLLTVDDHVRQCRRGVRPRRLQHLPRSLHGTGEGLSFSRLAGTMMACPPLLMGDEKAFHELITQVRRFDIAADGALLLIAADGRKLTARRP